MKESARSSAFIFMALAVITSGCGPTVQQKIAEYRGRYAFTRAAFASLSSMLPAEGSMREWGTLSGLDPKPIYDEEGMTSNTEIVMDWQLADPGADKGDNYDLLLSKDLVQCLRWTGPTNPLAESVRGGRANSEFIKTLDHGLTYRYLVVNRVIKHSPPEAVDEKTFHKGEIEMRCFVTDLRQPKVLGSFAYHAATNSEVNYSYKENEDNPKERLESWAASSLWDNARKELIRLLNEKTGGSFVLR